MLTRDSLFVILYSLPVYQFLFYTVQLITFKKSNPSRRYLGWMLLAMTIFLSINATYHLGYESHMAWLYFFFAPVLLSILPVFYLYIVSLARENQDVDDRTRLVLFLPPIAILLLNFIVYRGLSADEKMLFIQNGFLGSPGSQNGLQGAVLLHWAGMAALLIIQLLLALAGGYKVLRKEAEVMQKQPRHLAYLQIQWIMIISICVMIFVVSGAVLNLFGPAKSTAPNLVYSILMLLCGGLTGYFGMKQDTLLAQVSKMKTAGPESNQKFTEVHKEQNIEPAPTMQGAADEEEVRLIIARLEEVMRQDKPYLNPKFSMHDLCASLKISRRKVTYVINEVMDKNFYGVINDYRIEEAIRLLQDAGTADYKMDAIAEMVGFQSKSSFYACFKKYTGVTPTEYRLTNGK